MGGLRREDSKKHYDRIFELREQQQSTVILSYLTDENNNNNNNNNKYGTGRRVAEERCRRSEKADVLRALPCSQRKDRLSSR